MDIRIISTKIIELRHSRVILDFHIAELYGVETRVLKQAVRRNLSRFPQDFMFELTKDEWREVITNCDNLPGSAKFSPAVPFAFTEQGVAMLSSVLRSEKAVHVNIAVMSPAHGRSVRNSAGRGHSGRRDIPHSHDMATA